MPEPFQIMNGPSDARVAVLRVSGRLDSASAAELAQRCAAIGDSGRDLVLSLERVSFIASSGVGALLAVAEKFRASGHSMRLAALSPSVDAVIRLLNLDQFLTIHPTEVAAMTMPKAA
jgi:anti-anti-sigma factor